jgi:hypothetical protein
VPAAADEDAPSAEEIAADKPLVSEQLAPLELGARLEKRAAVHARFSHVIGRAVLLTMIYISACRAHAAHAGAAADTHALPRAVALEVFPRAMEPGGELWALLLVWVCSYHAGDLFERVGAPKALGMLVAGLVLRSLPPAQDNTAALDHLVNWWSKDFRAAAMALVLLRAGLGMDISSVVAYGWSLPVMATLPSLAESVIGAAFASYLFGMPFLLAWVMSFMVSAVGPAIIASGCAAVKEKGYVNKAPNFLMTTAVFDDTTCIIGFNCLLHAWIPGEGDVGWQYAIGPMNLVLGVFGGVVAALALSATALYPGTGPRTWTLFTVCMCMIFVAETHELLGAGAIANLVFGLGVRFLWKRGWPARFLAPEHAHDPAAASAEMLLSSMAGLYKVWNIVFYPLLFGLIGASLNARKADPTIGSLAVAYAFFTCGIRFLVTMGVTQLPMFRSFTPRERVFMSLAWISKATTQAAFATVPLIELTAWTVHHPGESWKGHSAADLILFGQQIQWCCVISIFVGTPLGTVFMNNGAPFLLRLVGAADADATPQAGDEEAPETKAESGGDDDATDSGGGAAAEEAGRA